MFFSFTQDTVYQKPPKNRMGSQHWVSATTNNMKRIARIESREGGILPFFPYLLILY